MTQREQLQMSYWQIAEPSVKLLTDNIIGDFVMGKPVTDDCKISLIHNLWFYLDIIQQQKEIDYANGIFTNDYNVLYCIDKIKKQLRCTGIDSNIITKLTDTYLANTIYSEGIGSMIIQGAVNPFRVRGDSGQGGGYISTSVPVNVFNQYITYIINQNISTCRIVSVNRTGISGDTTFLSLLPGNYKFNDVMFENITGNWAQLSMGITPGGVECFGSAGLNLLDGPTKGLTTVSVNRVFSLTSPTTLYLHHAGDGDAFNGAVFNIEFIFEKL